MCWLCTTVRALDSTLVRGDNSFYVDTNTAQKLTEPDICRLKESGLNGEEIIRTLIENSETFASKTDYAQEKWIKRKEMKYRKKVRIHSPFIASQFIRMIPV